MSSRRFGPAGSTWLNTHLAAISTGEHRGELVHKRLWDVQSLEKMMAERLLVGNSFGINVKNTPCVDYSRVLRTSERAQPRVLLLERCNVVKHAVSYLRVPMVSGACGAPHSRTNCTMLTPQPIELRSFRNALVCTSYRTRLARAAYARAPGPRMAVAYEEMQRDEAGTLRRLRAFLGAAAPAPAVSPPAHAGPSDRAAVKTGSDDLSAVVSNAAAVAAWLGTNAGACLRAQFDERGAQCTPCPDPWPDDACDQALFARFHDESNRLCDPATNQTYAEQLLGSAGLAVWRTDGSSTDGSSDGS